VTPGLPIQRAALAAIATGGVKQKAVAAERHNRRSLRVYFITDSI
jgi:hypothetical protein